jgi:protein O-mannosyl-transferase
MMKGDRHLGLGVVLILVWATLAVYWDVQNHEFINLDDNLYVTKNRQVTEGVSWDGLLWAFTSRDRTYWHPLTWLSHMMDCHLYGLNSKGHHLNNLLFHLANAVLLFLVLKRMSGELWPSAGVAAVFALHPLNVESVAWIASRKNVLSNFFWMLTLWAYVRYAEKPRLLRYLVVLLLFALGLLAKPMLVTLPFVLLLLDLWPLARFRLLPSWAQATASRRDGGSGFPKQATLRIIMEKLPLLLLSGASIWVSLGVAEKGGILLPDRMVPMGLRIQNALVSYVVYIRKTLWPHDLSVFVPYPASIPLWQSVAAGFFLIVITMLAVRNANRKPYVLVGWLWYMGSLLPVIGLVQQGLWPALADRFMYIPQVGLFIIIAWSIADLWVSSRLTRAVLRLAVAVLFLAIMIVTWVQVTFWRDSVTLFNHALEVTPYNFLGHMNLGTALAERHREAEAIDHFHKALDTGHPRPEQVHFNLGLSYAASGDKDQALWHYHTAARINPRYAEPYIALGTFWLEEKNFEESLRYSFRALEIAKDSAKAHNNVGVALLYQGKPEEAAGHFKEALRIDPGYIIAKKNWERAIGGIAPGVKD